MRNYWKYAGLLLLLFLLLPAKSSFAVSVRDDTIPSGTYFFSQSGVLATAGGVENPSLFGDIKKAKQNAIIEEVGKLQEDYFSSTSITGDLEFTNGSGSFWDDDALAKLHTNKVGTTFVLRKGTTKYSIYVPRGIADTVVGDEGPLQVPEEGQVNQQFIAAAIASIRDYQALVKESVLAASFDASYNIYTMYPSTQVPVVDILEDAKSSSGTKLGYKKVKSSGVTMNYALDYFINPVLGKMDPAAVEAVKGKWETKLSFVILNPSGGGKVDIDLNNNYQSFIAKDSEARETLADISKATVAKAKGGVKSWTAPTSGKKVEPSNYVDAGLRLAFPSLFGKKGSFFALDKDKGYTLDNSTKLLITHNMVYRKEGNTYSRAGDYAAYGVDDKSLVVSSMDTDGANGAKKTVGVVIPLWYKEAVYDTSSEGSKEIYLTGRAVKFGNDYSNKITLDQTNIDLLATDTKSGGKAAITLRKFAFMPAAKYTSGDDHVDLPVDQDAFTLQTVFGDKEDGAKGFLLFRNNASIKDSDLIQWLDSDPAKALTEVKSKELLEKINGSFNMENAPLTYEDWQNVGRIKTELSGSKDKSLTSLFYIITLSVGFLIIFYSILLVILYFIDIFNVFVDFSFLNFVTFGRLYPISSEEDLSYLSATKGDLKYVGKMDIIIRCVVGMGIGLILMLSTPILNLILWLYFHISSWAGGI